MGEEFIYLNQVDGAEQVRLVVEEGLLARLSHSLQTGHVNHTVDLVLQHTTVTFTITTTTVTVILPLSLRAKVPVYLTLHMSTCL